ncbi:hypothetical protein SLS62_002654 [Diatrype stigma]|uniref:Programmed cell death protein 2 C-terminal domain-containing protein n=1 Tax=Diatrype stigma TaxID=117547 RepID=A0AAN9UY21_9PEZI
MAPHDSDSSGDEQEDYTETNVLLGYASKEPEDISHLGGRPEWLDPDSPPSAALARCKVCRDLMVLLLQLNAELPAQFPGHERRLYVFSCRRKTCRRKEGTIRVVRGVRIAPGSGTINTTKGEEEKSKPKQESSPTPAPPPPSNLGETLFGAKTLGLSSSSSSSPFASANPFSTGNGGSSGSSNPFSTNSNPFSNGNSNGNGTPAATTSEAPSKPAPTTDDNAAKEEERLESLPKTFAETLSLNNPQQQQAQPTTPSTPEPWPPESEQPRPYATSYLTDADYETLDPTPAPIPQATVQMDIDEDTSKSGGGKGGKEDRDVFESTMDAAFQRFADRLAQNPEQTIRYEFGGQPLLSSRADAVGKLLSTDDNDDDDNDNVGKVKVKSQNNKGAKGRGMPRCASCGARRTFEVQLCPQAIAELEADEDVQAQLEEGIDWTTVIVGVCERDCQAPGVGEGGAGYLEEWAGVQWEELTSGRR